MDRTPFGRALSLSKTTFKDTMLLFSFLSLFVMFAICLKVQIYIDCVTSYLVIRERGELPNSINAFLPQSHIYLCNGCVLAVVTVKDMTGNVLP